MQWTFRGLELWICGLAACWLCGAQTEPRPSVTAGEEDTYCFGCPRTARFGPHPRSTAELIQLANSHSPLLRQAIEETYPSKALELGRVWSGHLHDFFFAVRATARPAIILDDRSGPAMQSLEGTDLWYTVAHIEQLGALHDFHYQSEGRNFGGSSYNLAAFTDLSFPLRGAPHGQLSARQTLTSKLYGGIKNDYWIYTPPGYDPGTPAALTIFLDGGNFLARQTESRIFDTIDNLIYLGKIPKMLLVFLDPGKIDESAKAPALDRVREFANSRHSPLDQTMRSIQEDAVTDTYPRLLRDELLPNIAAHYNLRRDGYSHAIAGISSGGLAAFNAAWQLPDDFARVLCGVSSFTSIQWKTSFAGTDGGQDYPDKVLHEQHRNIRVWLQAGTADLESDEYGSWALNNVRLANALKLKSYDFHFSFGKGGHGPEQIEAQFPDEMTWLWRDYDPSRTEQVFEIEPAEKTKPPFRVAIANRDAN